MSYFYPVTIRTASDTGNIPLMLFLYRNQLQLGNTDFLYSDGRRYRPAVVATDQLKAFLPSVHSVLALGTGLASIVHVLHGKGYHPRYTLVENNKTILQWALEFLEEIPATTDPVCRDAMVFMEQNTTKYDLIFIDVFMGRVVPGFVTSAVFLQYCRDSMAPGGHLAFNYIVNDRQEWESVKNVFSVVFPKHRIIEMDINRMMIV